MQAEKEVGEVEAVQVSPGSASQNNFGVADVGKMSTTSEKKLSVSVEVGLLLLLLFFHLCLLHGGKFHVILRGHASYWSHL